MRTLLEHARFFGILNIGSDGRRRMRTWIKIVLLSAVVVAVFLVAVGLWSVHHVDRYLPQMIAYIQKKTGKQIEIRHASVSLLPLTVRLYDVGIRNPKPFPTGYFLKVPMMTAAVEVVPLIHGIIAIQSLVLDQPVIDFVSDPDGLWNFQNPGTPANSTTKMRFSMGPIAKVAIHKGKLLGSSLIDPADTFGPVVLEIDNFSATVKQFDFNAFKADPNAKAAGHLDADVAGFGDIHVKNLHSGILVSPVELMFKNFQAKTYRGRMTGNFTLNLAGKNPSFHSDLNVSGIGVPYLLGEFQKGPPAMTGMMQAKLTVGGEIVHTAHPLAGISGAGQFIVRNGEFPSLTHNKSMAEMKRFRNPSAAAKPISAFSQFAGDVELKNHRFTNRKIGFDFYGIDIAGGGTLNEANGGLNYTGAATIEKKQGFFTNVFARMFKEAKEKQGRLTFPIRLVGTLSNPKFSVTE